MSTAQLAQIEAINADAAAPLDAVLVDARALPGGTRPRGIRGDLTSG
jgi:hypothetical protein